MTPSPLEDILDFVLIISAALTVGGLFVIFVGSLVVAAERANQRRRSFVRRTYIHHSQRRRRPIGHDIDLAKVSGEADGD